MQLNRLAFFTAVCLAGVVWLAVPSTAMAAAGDESTAHGIYRGVSTAVKFDVSPPLHLIAPLPIQPEEHTELEDCDSGFEGPLGPQDFDPLVQFEVGPGEIPAPLVSFNGPSSVGVTPPDPVGDVGPNHYVVMSSRYFAVYSKAGALLFGPAANNTLWAGLGGPCQTENAGDPIVLYDQLADRWYLTQPTAAGPTYYNCVAVSQTGDPTGSYYRYAFTTGSNRPDDPKYGVWPDALYISTREFTGGTFTGVGAYAINRAQLIAGNPTPQVISFQVTPASAGGAYRLGDGLLPTDLDGWVAPPAGTPNFFIGSMDNGGPYAAPQDALTLWRFTANFITPGSSTFVLRATLPIAAYDTIPAFCGGSSCVPQPGTTNELDHLGYLQRPLHRAAYRNFGSHQSIVTNQSVEASATMSGIRWWELRNPNGTPVVYQQGTYAPGTTDGIHRWMGSIAMDRAGNMALGYSASDSTSTYPSVRYTGRLVTDRVGTMPQGEGVIFAGTGSQTGSQRWGDYSSMNIDPVDDCTFWYVNEYVPTTSAVGWRLRIGAFTFPSCSSLPRFTLAVTPSTQSVCAPASATYAVNIGSVSGFNSPVTLSATGNPAGTTVGFSPNPVTPLPGSSTLTIGNTGAAAAGSYTVNVTGSAAGPIYQKRSVVLNVHAGTPGAPTLTAPADCANNQPLSPTFTWSASSQAATYTLEIATDPGFGNIVHTGSNIATTTYSGATLNWNTVYYWRVRGNNACGSGGDSGVFRLTTQPQLAPGDCPLGTTANILYSENFETGAPGWTHSGTGDTWALSTANPHSPTTSYFATDPATVSDQRLVSSPIVIPTGNAPIVLKFWNWQHMETLTGGCYDGGILETSTDGGTTWTQVPNSKLLTDPYDGQISTGHGNPLGGRLAWCGNNPQPYLQSIVDVTDFAGETVQFRFREGTDTSVSRPGWHIDDVVVQNCPSRRLVKGDFNQDSKVDLLLDNSSDNSNMVWLMDGAQRMMECPISPDATTTTQKIVGADDFNGDGKSDLVFQDTEGGALEFWMMDGTTRTGDPQPISGPCNYGQSWELVATGDFNRDGKPDLLWQINQILAPQLLTIWTMNGTTCTGTITPQPNTVPPGSKVVAALDYNNDGNRDLLLYNRTSDKLQLWFMNAAVKLIESRDTSPAGLGYAGDVVAAGDYGAEPGHVSFNNDIVWQSESGGIELWYMDGNGKRTWHACLPDPYVCTLPSRDWIVVGPR